MYNIDYINNATEITSVDDYIKRISDLYNNPEYKGMKFFFRGQAADIWDIRPSIFREDMLSVEHELMTEPIRILPKEFRFLGDTFEIMEKYQHYGLSTRLLDLTSNPLVALYFACELCNKEEIYQLDDSEEVTRYPNGVVYIKQTDSVHNYDSKIVKIISFISKTSFDGEIKMQTLLEELRNEGIIQERTEEEIQIRNIISILQDSYVVMPAINNERLSRQSGAFLLPAKFNVKNIGNDIKSVVVEKAECDLREEFNDFVFYVEHDNKKKIREELNNYNINEASLFPELEYQLKRIQVDCESNKKSVARFEKYIELWKDKKLEENFPTDISLDTISDIVKENVNNWGLSNSIIDVFKNNNETDWYKKRSVLSRIKICITRELISGGYNKKEASVIAEKIMNDVRDEKRG